MNHRIIEVGEENDGLGHLALLSDGAVLFLFIKKKKERKKISISEKLENENTKFKRDFSKYITKTAEEEPDS